MRIIFQYLMPYRPNRKWYQSFFQIILMGYLGFFVTVASFIFAPFFLIYLAYCLSESAIRGTSNRLCLFLRGTTPSQETCWWDSAVQLSLWAMAGAIFGRIISDWQTSFAVSMIFFLCGGMMELIYAASDILPSAFDPTHVICKNHFNSASNNVNNNQCWVKVKTWSWTGYQPELGPKEDVFFPRKD